MPETLTSTPAPQAPVETPAPTTTTPAPAPSPGTPPAQPAAQPAQAAEPQEPVYTLTLPQDSPLEASAVERLTAFAKDHKLTPEAAQKNLELVHAETASFVQRQQTEYKAKVDGWEKAVKEDKELGGANHTRTLSRVKAVMDKYASPELKEAFNKTGFGNYPALVRFVEQIGAAMEGDQITRPTGTSEPDANYLDRMFPTSAGK